MNIRIDDTANETISATTIGTSINRIIPTMSFNITPTNKIIGANNNPTIFALRFNIAIGNLTGASNNLIGADNNSITSLSVST